MTCGIYQIINLKNKKIYIGASIDIENRIKSHFYSLKANKHENREMQKDYNNNIDNVYIWDFNIIKRCTENDLDREETLTIDEYNENFKCDCGKIMLGHCKCEQVFRVSCPECSAKLKLEKQQTLFANPFKIFQDQFKNINLDLEYLKTELFGHLQGKLRIHYFPILIALVEKEYSETKEENYKQYLITLSHHIKKELDENKNRY